MKTEYTQLKYQQVEAKIRDLAQTLPFGAKLPPERELAETYDCSFLTIRRAFKALVKDGTVVRRVGSGTFILRHPFHRSLSGDTETRVGVLISQESNAYAHRLTQAVAHASLKQNIELRSAWVQDFGDNALTLADSLKQDGCVALTVPWFPHERIEEIRQFVDRSPLPVSMAMLIPGLEKNCYFVEVASYEQPIISVCQYCRVLGYRRIALLGPDSPGDTILQRMILEYSFYTPRENLAGMCGLVAPGAAAIDRLAEEWKAYRGELAIVCYDDEHALRFLTAMHKIGLSAPADFCIVGCNDTDASRYSDPPLTTVHQPFERTGYWLLKNALALSRGTTDQKHDRQKSMLVVRSTCGGAEKITDEFRAKLPNLDIFVEGRSSADKVAIEALSDSPTTGSGESVAHESANAG